MKKVDSFLRDYANKLNEDDLKFLYFRLNQRLSGDLPEALHMLSENYEMDKLLASAKTADELYDLLDTITRVVEKEYGLMCAA